MANPVKGEVGFTVDGQSYVFLLGTIAQAMLERKYKTSIVAIFERMQRDAVESSVSVDDLLAIFHAGLYRHHKLSEEQVGDILDSLSNERKSEILVEAASLAAARNTGAANGDARPPSVPAISTQP